MRTQLAKPDLEIARIATRQHGVVSTVQLRGLGLDSAAVRRRVEAGRLHPLHRGVYVAGHLSLSWRGRWTAAVLAVGDQAVLSHHSAAALWRFIEPIGGRIDVTVARDTGRATRSHIRIHRSRTLEPRTITRRHRIPVTNPARTIADLDGTVEPYLLRRAIRQAELRGYRLGTGVTVHRTRSDLELDFLALCARHDIPRPEVNARVGRFEVDFLWRKARVAVETDSWEYHRGSVAFEDDHDRELELRARRIELIRITGRQLQSQERLVIELLKEYL